MRQSQRRSPLGAVLFQILIIGLLVGLVVALLAIPEASLDSSAPDEAVEQAILESVRQQGYDVTPQEAQYYHQPVLVSDSVTTGAGRGAWQGLCTYLQTEERLEACYLSADTEQAIGQTIAQAERDMVPSAIVAAGDCGSAAVESAQQSYQGTYFLVLDGTVEPPAANTCNLTFATEQAGFLAGYAAGMEGFFRLWFLGEAEDSQTLLYESGFYQGADCAARNLGRQITVTSCFGSDGMAQAAAEGAEMAFVCGSLEFQTAAAEQALESGLRLIGTDPGMLEFKPELADAMLTFAVKNYAAVTQSALEALQAGAWNQFYSGQTLCYDLQWGEAVALDTAQWQFSSFSAAQYYQILANLANDPNYQVAQQLPDAVRERVQP